MKFSFRRFMCSFKFAFQGIVAMLREEQNMRVHVAAAVVVVMLGVYFDVTALEWCVLVICIGMVLAAEAANTAIERLVNLVHPETHPLAGKIKDVAAAGALIASVAAAIVGGIIFGKYFFISA